MPGFWVAAGLSLNGFGGAGGIGRALAEWWPTGESELDLASYRAWRFGPAYRDPCFAAAGAREVYRYYYRLRYPLDSDEWGRGRGDEPAARRAAGAGRCLRAKNGWERADYFEPGGPWRRAARTSAPFGWAGRRGSSASAVEHAAFRERVGIIDMTSFGKLEVAGPGALALLERVCDSRIDRPPGASSTRSSSTRAAGSSPT